MSGNVTCVQNPPETWWLNSQGENPCQSYQRLIRVCQASYTMQNTPLPPFYAVCNGSQCCCTSVAYSLLSACWSCQWGPQAPPSNPGTFDTYMSGSCINWTNGTLPDALEQSMRPSVPAPWAYIPLSQHAIWSYAAAQQNASAVFTSTASVASVSSISVGSISSISRTSVGTSSSTSTSTTPTGGQHTEGQPTAGQPVGSDSSKNSTPIGAIVGGIVGGLAFIVFLVLLVWCIRRRRPTPKVPPIHARQNEPLMHGSSFQATPFVYPNYPSSSPYTPSTPYTTSQYDNTSSGNPTPASQGVRKPRLSGAAAPSGSSTPTYPVVQQEIDAGAVPNVAAEPSVVRLPPSYDPRWSQGQMRK